MSLLIISGLTKGYGAQSVLQDVSLRVARGEKIGIVGKNGGGKTTLLRLILGRETADAGSIHVARGVRIGYLSQIAALDEGRTVREEAETALEALFTRFPAVSLAVPPEDLVPLPSLVSNGTRSLPVRL